MKSELTKWFALKAFPFGKNIHAKNLFVYPQLEELHQTLAVTLAVGSGMLVTAQAGTGKTTAIRGFLGSLTSNDYRVVYLGNDQNGTTLFARLGVEIGLRLSNSRQHRMLQLSQHIQRHIIGTGKKLLLVIDEAHLLPGKTLEDIRLLTNSQMDSRNDIILLMLGQLWLRSKLKHHGHEALYQRMSFRYGLEGLSKSETRDYIRHHLALVGCTKELFTPEAYDYLFLHSGGILREINNLALDSLLKAMNLKKQKVDENILRMVVNQRESS